MKSMLRKKLSDRQGFTLAEMLITVLILLMVSGVVAAGIPSAANAYQKVMDNANAQVLLSTTLNTFRSELMDAEKVYIDTIPASTETGFHAVDCFESRNTDLTRIRNWDASKDSINDPDGIYEACPMGLVLAVYLIDKSTGFTERPGIRYPLVAWKSQTDTNYLYTKFSSFEYNAAKGLFKITGLAVYRTTDPTGDDPLAAADVVYIRAANVAD